MSTGEEGEGRRFVLDDGTGMVELSLTKDVSQHQEFAAGRFVLQTPKDGLQISVGSGV